MRKDYQDQEDYLVLDREQLVSGGQQFGVGLVKGSSLRFDIAVHVKEPEKVYSFIQFRIYEIIETCRNVMINSQSIFYLQFSSFFSIDNFAFLRKMDPFSFLFFKIGLFIRNYYS